MAIKRGSLLAIAVLLFVMLQLAAAENISSPVDGAISPKDNIHERSPIPHYQSPPSGKSLVLPKLKEKRPDRVSGPKIFVRQFHFIGNTVFSNQELSKLSAPYSNREISNEELQELRFRLTLLYIDKGYINSGVIIPDQKIENGVVTLQVIEGRISKIEITGLKRLRPQYIRSRLKLGAGPPLNINTLQERIQILSADPLIHTIKAVLSPGVRPGEALLTARVDEASHWSAGFEFSNDRSPFIGEYYGQFHIAYRDLTGWGDCIRGKVGGLKGGGDYAFDYVLPVTPRDTAILFHYDGTDVKVVEDPFEQLDIKSRSQNFRVAISHPLYKSAGCEDIIMLSAERRNSETFLLGEPFSFSPGIYNGRTRLEIMRLSNNWLLRSRYQVLNFRNVFSLGRNVASGKRVSNGPDRNFFIWLAQFQWARRFEQLANSQTIFRTDLQLTDDSLFPIEKFSIGGAQSVRGYQENQFISDIAAVASIELRIPVWRVPLPWISKGPEDGVIQLAPFYDWGWYNDNGYSTNEGAKTLSSIGSGLRWNPSPRIHAEIYYGYPLRDIENKPSNGLQNNGVYFRIGFEIL